MIQDSAEEMEPHRLVFYLMELAGEFHRYYNRFRVISDDAPLTRARLLLAREVQAVVRKGLQLLGLSVPHKMETRVAMEASQGNEDR